MWRRFIPWNKPRQHFAAAEPALSPDGRLVAFVVRPCDAKQRLDAVEGAGFVVLYDRQVGRLRVVQESLDTEGGAKGYANLPAWSDDGRLLSFSYEDGFVVVEVASGAVKTPPVEEWSSAIGWIGAFCVVYTEGSDWKDARKNPLRLWDTRTGQSDVLSNGVLGAISVKWPYAIFKAEGETIVKDISTPEGKQMRFPSDVGVNILTGHRPLDDNLPRLCR